MAGELVYFCEGPPTGTQLRMDATDFKRRYLPHYPLLYRVAYSLTSSEADAEDLVQDLYLRLWQRREALGPEAHRDVYLVRSLKNLFIEQCRIHRLDTSVLCDLAQMAGDENPERHTEVQDLLELLHRTISGLPDAEREALRMHIVEGKTYEEMHGETGQEQGALRIAVMRARNKIKTQLSWIMK